MQRVSSPSRLGRYPVRRRIGAGAFATVWLAYDEQLDSPVAIKVLADNWSHDESVRHRFLEEGRFLRRVESEHVVQVHDVGELDDGRPFLVLTYADRGTLADRLKECWPDARFSAETTSGIRPTGRLERQPVLRPRPQRGAMRRRPTRYP
jgi:serine/threonine protein kinase